MIAPFILTLVVAFIIALNQGDTIADVYESSWDFYYEEVTMTRHRHHRGRTRRKPPYRYGREAPPR